MSLIVPLSCQAGARTTSDTFHDLHATNIVDTSFLQRCDGLQGSVSASCEQLGRISYWRTKVTCLVALPLLGNFNFFSVGSCGLLGPGGHRGQADQGRLRDGLEEEGSWVWL